MFYCWALKCWWMSPKKKQSFLVNPPTLQCEALKQKFSQETAKSAICNSSSSIITGNVIRFDNNFLFFGKFFSSERSKNISRSREGDFAKYRQKLQNTKEFRVSAAAKIGEIPYFITTILFFYWCNFYNSNVVKRFSKNSHAASIARLTVIIIIYRNV